MDTLTHALSGALIARATAPRQTTAGTLPLARRMLVGFLAAAAPDLDFITGYFGQLAYLYHHRGVTHSILLLPLWAILIAWLCALVWRRDRHWRAYFGVAALGLGIHILGDLITAFGTMIFAPLSDARIEWATTFIIDLWFTGIIIAGLVASAIWRRARAPAVAGMAVLAGYVGWQAQLHHEAVQFGRAYAREAGFAEARVTAQPRPPFPLNWMIIAEEGERLDYAMVKLRGGAAPPPLALDAGFFARIAAPYLPLDHVQWVTTVRYGANPEEAALARMAWEHPRFEFFRWFAQYPVLHGVERGNAASCAWFQDLRFFTPGRSTFPFRYGLCRGEEGVWLPYQLVGEAARVPVR